MSHAKIALSFQFALSNMGNPNKIDVCIYTFILPNLLSAQYMQSYEGMCERVPFPKIN